MNAARLGSCALLVITAFALGRIDRVGALATPQDEKAPSPQEIQKRDLQQRSRGPEHATLAKRVGDWDLVYTFPMYQGMQMRAEAKSRLILGGNFVETTILGSMMGQAIEALNLRGYDTLAEEHISISMDSMYTLATEMRGKAGEDGVVTMGGIMKDSMSPGGRPFRAEEQTISDDEYKVTVYDLSDQPDREFVAVILHFKRKVAEGEKN